MTAFGKALAIFVTVASVAFMAFGLLLWTTPNPSWEAKANEVPNYTFVRSTGENATWTATPAISPTGKPISNKVLPKLIEAAYKQLDKDLKAQTALSVNGQPVDMKTQTTALTEEYKTYTKNVEVAIAGLEVKQKEILDEISDITKKTEDAFQKGNEKTKEAEKTRFLSKLRREDIQRLTSELEEIKVDLQRMEDQQKQLNDLIIRFEGVAIRLENRNQLLKSQFADGAVPNK